jgi:hypothetical protein
LLEKTHTINQIIELSYIQKKTRKGIKKTYE